MQSWLVYSMLHHLIRHDYCPKSPVSWCQYQRDQINNTNLYKPGPGLSRDTAVSKAS